MLQVELVDFLLQLGLQLSGDFKVLFVATLSQLVHLAKPVLQQRVLRLELLQFILQLGDGLYELVLKLFRLVE